MSNDLIFKIGAEIAGFKAAMADVNSTLNSSLRDAQKGFSGFDKLGSVLQGVGTSMSIGITLPLVAAGGAALKFASDFDGAMRQVTSLVGNVSQKEFKQLSDQTLALAKSMGIDAVDAAHGLYEAISANIPKENALEFIRVAANTGIAGLTDTKTAVDGLTTVLNSYGLEATEAQNVSDAMFQAVNFGKVNFEQLAASVGIAASGAKNMGISYEDLLGTMAAITLQGKTSAEAFTEMQAAMKALQSPNEKMNDLISKTGFASAQALVDSKGFAGALQSLNTAAKGNSAALNDAFGRIEGYNAMLHVTGPGVDIVSKSLGMMNDKLGATGRAQAEIEQGGTRMWERFQADIKNTAIAAGQQLLPAFKGILEAAKPIGQFVADAITGFSHLPTPLQTTALALVGIAAAVGPILVVGGTLLSTFASVATAVTGVSALAVKFASTALPAVSVAMSSLATTVIPEAIAALGLFASTTIPNAILQVGFLSEIMLRQAITSIGTFATTAIPAAISAVGTFATVAIPAAITAMIEFATVSIPAAITSLGTFTLTSVPAAASALMSMATGGLAAASAGIASMASSAVPYLIAALSTLGVGVAIGAAAFAGWKIGEWAYSNIPGVKALGDSIADLVLKIPGSGMFINWLADSSAATNNLEQAVAKNVQTLAAHGVVVDRGSKSLEAYAAQVNSALRGVLGLGDSHSAVVVATDKLISSQRDLTKEYQLAKAVYAEVQQRFKDHKATSEDVSAAYKKLQSAAAAAGKQIQQNTKTTGDASAAAKDHTKVMTDQEKIVSILEKSLSEAKHQLGEVSEAQRNGLASTKDVADAQAKVSSILTALHPQWTKQTDALALEAFAAMDLAGDMAKLDAALHQVDGTSDKFTDTLQKLGTDMSGVRVLTSDLADAYKTLGIKTSASLKDTADSTEAAYETIVSSGSATAGEVEQAWRKMTEAARDYAESIGDAELAASLDKQLDAHKDHGAKVKSVWGDTVKQVSTIISDMGKGFANGIFKLFDNSDNDKLDADASKLRGELDVKTGEYSAHVADVTAELDKIPAAYEEALAKLEGTTSEKLGSLDKDYAKSVKKIQDDFAGITKKAQDQLDKQLRDLDDQLSDKRRSYDRSTQDAQNSYDRDTGNLKESLSDKERDYKHWVEQQNLDLKQLEGDNSASAQRQREDILLHLQQRAEDMEDTRQDFKDSMAEEEADLKLSLARKKEDWDLEQAEIAARQLEAKTTFKTTMTEAQNDLATSLAERKTAYDDDKTAAIAAYEEAKAGIIEKFKDQTDALNTELAKQKTAYDTYKTDITSKLADLEAAHKGPLDRIGEMFAGVFTSAGEALLRFAGEEVMGKLMGKLTDLVAMIPGLGGIGGIFGNASTAVGSTVGASGGVLGTGVGAAGSVGTTVAGSVGSSGSSAASGAASTLGNVASGIGIATGIISAGADVYSTAVLVNIKDCLNDMRNDTKFNSWVWDAGGMHQNLLLLGSNIDNFVNGAFGGWFHDSFASLMTTVEDMKTDLSFNTFWALDALQDIKAATRFDVVPGLAAIQAAVTGQGRSITVNNYGPVYGVKDLVNEVKQALSQELALQG